MRLRLSGLFARQSSVVFSGALEGPSASPSAIVLAACQPMTLILNTTALDKFVRTELTELAFGDHVWLQY